MNTYVGRFIELVKALVVLYYDLLVLGEGSRILAERPRRYREVWYREGLDKN